MLVLSRHRGESIIITHPDGTRVVATVIDIRGDKVRLGFAAPPDVAVNREELQRKIDEGGRPEMARIGGET